MTEETRITVADIDMPFGSMVSFMVKWAFATIPALIIICFITFMILALLAALFGGLGAGIGALAK